jgi:hypothetical protein
MLLGAIRLTRRILALLWVVPAALVMNSCGGTTTALPTDRVFASQYVTSASIFGEIVVINGQDDTLPRTSPLNAGSEPLFMAISPTRDIVMAFDQSSNSVYSISTAKDTSLGTVRLPGPTWSMVVPTPQTVAYAAVPSATVSGYTFVGGLIVMNLSAGGITTTIAVPNAQTVVSNGGGSQLLVFSNDSDNVTVLAPGNALPIVDTSCLQSPPSSSICTVLSSGFSRPVNAIISGNTAYVLNCGVQCGGLAPASVSVLDLTTLTVTNSVPVDAATMAFLSGTTLYVAGTPPAPNNACTGETTAATSCGRLDIVNLDSLTVSPGIVITDGYHDQMDMSLNGQLFIGSKDCTNIGNANYPSGEVRGCLTIYNTETGGVIIPPDNGDVGGLQGFSSRYIEYVAEGGNLRVYDTTKDILYITDYLTSGTIPVAGYVSDVKAVDFF